MDLKEAIEKLNEEEAKTPTVSQLIEHIEKFPGDRKIYISYEPDRKQRYFIKEMSYVVDMDTNLSHPQITVGKIGIRF